MRVLAIGAHPDDLEWSCYGTLAKFIKQGHRVTTATLTNGDLGHKTILPAQLAELRHEEALNAAQVINVHRHVCLGVGDNRADSHVEAQIQLVVQLIRESKPDIIITHYPDDYHRDHMETSQVVFRASFAATIPHVMPEIACHEVLTPIYYMDAPGCLAFTPREFVDITDVFDLKKEALAKHATQIEWIRAHTHADLVEEMAVIARFRGMQCSCTYAEAFALCEKSPRMVAQRFLP